MQSKRKDEHIAEALNQEVKMNDFDNISFMHHALPKYDLKDISLKTMYLNSEFNYPFYINAMTGGSKKAKEINRKLSKLANEFGLMMVLGSQSIAIKDGSYADTFSVARQENPYGYIVANLSANATVSEAEKAIQMIDANALSIHINSVQELIMVEGDIEFKHWKENIREIVQNIDVPVIVKEVGFGLSSVTINELKDIGVKYFDVSGKGGTNFASIENQRGGNLPFLEDWGISTVNALIDNKNVTDAEVFASGGIRHALDVVKALVLGAKAVGLSKFFLELSEYSYDLAKVELELFIQNIKKIMVLLSVDTTQKLREVPYIIKK